VLSLQVIRPLASLWRHIAEAMLQPTSRVEQDTAAIARRRMQTLRLHAGVTVAVLAVLVIVWALTGGPFWPIWPGLALGLAPAIHASIVLAAGDQGIVRRDGLTTRAPPNGRRPAPVAPLHIPLLAARGG